MDDVITAGDLIAQGVNPNEMRSLVRRGTLTRLRHGSYLLGPRDPDEDDPGGYLAHRRLIDASLKHLDPGAVLSHGSAAVLHRLPIWRHSIMSAHVTRDGNEGGERRRHVHVHKTPVSPDEITTVDGIAVTTLARTVADLGRSTPLMESVAMGDQALRSGLGPDDLQRVLRGMKRWPGVRSARTMADLIDVRSESPGESASRVRMVQDGIPLPELQRVILDDYGEFVARVDFAWEERRTVGEFDGAIKYGTLLRPGQTAVDVLEDQGRREDAIRGAGWEIARWGWPQLGQPDEVASRIRAAFSRAATRTRGGA